MSATLIRVVGFSFAALVVLWSGVRLTRAGWPFGTGLLAAHKLVALAGVVMLGVIASAPWREGTLSSADRAALLGTAVLVIASLASGGVVSAKEHAPAVALWIHRIGSWVTAVAIGWCLSRIL